MNVQVKLLFITFSCLLLLLCCNTFPQNGLSTAKIESINSTSSDNYNVSLRCVPGKIELNFNFASEFRGIIFTQTDRSEDCQLKGDGRKEYLMTISLQKCGTIEDPERTFTNTIVLRYHPVLEIGGDETKTIVCKYGEVRFVFGNVAENESTP